MPTSEPDFKTLLRRSGVETLRVPTARTGGLIDGLRGDPKSGGIRWGPEFYDFERKILSLEAGTIEQVKENMKEVGASILEEAKSGTPAFKKWVSHPERHRGSGQMSMGTRAIAKARERGEEGPRWPHNKTAREGLFCYIRQRKSFIELGLSHDPQTLYRTNSGALVNYGAFLETGFGGKYAVIAATLGRHHRDVLDAATDALTLPEQVRMRGNAGGKTIADGWLKRGKD